MTRKILILTANPAETARLRQDEEMRKIQKRFRRANQRNKFDLIFECARTIDVLDFIEDEKPEIVHFSGHGTEEWLVFESTSGNARPVTPKTLGRIFEDAPYVKCVLLNACYSEAHAKVISEHVDYTIGMKGSILDRAAIAFASAFYKALAAGDSIESAFKRGDRAASLEEDDENPILLVRKKSPNDALKKISEIIQIFLIRKSISLRKFLRISKKSLEKIILG
jgi:hypothetical protein